MGWVPREQGLEAGFPALQVIIPSTTSQCVFLGMDKDAFFLIGILVYIHSCHPQLSIQWSTSASPAETLTVLSTRQLCAPNSPKALTQPWQNGVSFFYFHKICSVCIFIYFVWLDNQSLRGWSSLPFPSLPIYYQSLRYHWLAISCLFSFSSSLFIHVLIISYLDSAFIFSS